MTSGVWSMPRMGLRSSGLPKSAFAMQFRSPSDSSSSTRQTAASRRLTRSSCMWWPWTKHTRCQEEAGALILQAGQIGLPSGMASQQTTQTGVRLSFTLLSCDGMGRLGLDRFGDICFGGAEVDVSGGREGASRCSRLAFTQRFATMLLHRRAGRANRALQAEVLLDV